MLNRLDRLVEALAVICLVASTAMICANVFYRYVVLGWLRGSAKEIAWLAPAYDLLNGVFGTVSVSADEVPGYLLVWIAFLGAYLALRRDGHIAFDLLLNALAPRPRWVLRSLIDGAVLGFLAVLLWEAVRMIRVDGSTEIETAEIAQGWFMAIMPLAAVLLGLALVVRLVARTRERPDTDNS